ncbi:MAG: hypothetical protein HMLKMBBP_00062 [Planctomycetes bacterium]|nr:hypothetical protein [Planctomycetota bacterium]
MIALVDADGAPVEAAADVPVLLRGVRPGADSAPVTTLGETVAWVVAAPERAGASAAGVARRAASLLAELGDREGELNDFSRELLGAYEELNLFYDLADGLAGAADPESVCRMALGRAMRVIPASRGWILLADPATSSLRLAAGVRVPEGEAMPSPGEGAAGRSLSSRTCDVVDDAAGVAATELHGWERSAARSLLTVPMVLGGRDDRLPVGLLQFADRTDGAAFTSSDVKLASALASHAAMLVENQRLAGYERELRIARSIQQSLLPASPPRVAGLDVAGACNPASNVGGDYYDHVVSATGAVGLLVADVSGHNLAAALLQTAARSALRSEILAGGAPGRVLERTGRALYDDLTRADLFLTAWHAEVDGSTGRVAFADAGHNPALIVRACGAAEWISAGGPPLGVLPDAEFPEGEAVLRPGDVLVAYTDGITEARPADGTEEFGEARLAAVVVAARSGEAASIVSAVLDEASRWCAGAPQADDRSLIVVKRI